MEAGAELEGYKESLQRLSALASQQEEVMKDALEYVLRLMVNHAKNNGNYTDRSSNLRNSISCNIKEMQEYPSDTDPSVLEAKVSENEKPVLEKQAGGWGGAISVGMEYAIWVETKQGYTVLQGTIDAFEPVIERYFKDKMHINHIDLEELAKKKYKELYG